MLQYFENGMALYVMAVIFALGAVSKMVASHTYKRMIRQCDNLGSIKDGYLRQIRSKYESLYRLNDGIKNCGVFVEKQVNGYRILRIPIQRWENMAMHAALFCFLAGVGTSFLCFWYSLGVRPVVLHFVSGVMFGVALVIVDGIADTGTKKDMLIVHIQDYLENNFASQIIRGSQTENRKNVAAATRSGMQDDIFMKKKEEQLEKEEAENGWKFRERKRKEVGSKNLERGWEAEKTERARDADTIRRGMEQIAASRETKESIEERTRRKLTPEEEQLLEDIIKEYLN